MSHWSAENATKAYLRTIKMGKRGKEPDVAEFISALAGGNNAQLMVEVCGSTAGSNTLALVAAAHQTGGRVVCILPSQKELRTSKFELMSRYVNRIEFVTGDALSLLSNEYKSADFVTVDCNINCHEMIFKEAQNGGIVVGYNAQHLVPSSNELGGHFLPIGEGLLVSKVPKRHDFRSSYNGKRSKWIVKVDKCTGEEHVFRITCPQQKIIQA
ncbi:uncharacterized protein LOC104905399 [Beta vulgaris subsp. vulgaris]|uniref:uncharacterized protein LOC104905399 n=1 Tax=Beta vulgaris subsp. vulgaris TaxID=3555 RepID=UPI0020367AB1|nr:uncharacterized protein LOC104905399 [Beta vulgaris subsp. vulgaris]